MDSRDTMKRLGIVGLVIVVLIVAYAVINQHSYFLVRVDQQEVGVQFRGGRITQVVPARGL